jgi:uncharacterized membrane protein (DUF373 family)
MFLNTIKRVKKVIIAAIAVMMTLVLILTAADLGWILVVDFIFHEPMFMLSIDDLLSIFGLFMLVLIGIELLETIVKMYLMGDSISVQSSYHAQVVLSVAIIALARKIIILDFKELPPLAVVGIAALTISLCAGFYFIRRVSERNGNEVQTKEEVESN